MFYSLFWTQERIDRCFDMAARGMSAGKIAAELGEGCTRNMVCGYVNRAKRKLLGSDTLDGVPHRHVRKRRKRKPVPQPTDVVSMNVTLDAKASAQCSWITNHNDAAPLYCGQPVQRASFCSDHYRIAYVPPKIRSQPNEFLIQRWTR